ncbi:family 95 glycoside hydrolase [Trichoderma ceciliae]
MINILGCKIVLANGFANYAHCPRYLRPGAYSLGDGNLRATPLGLVEEDTVVLNEHSLWPGGPFQIRAQCLLTSRFLCSLPLDPLYCAFPDQPLPAITIGLQDTVRSNPSSNSSCDTNGVHLRGQTHQYICMVLDAHVRVVNQPKKVTCTGSHELVVSVDKGTTIGNYSFMSAVASKSYDSIYNAHVKDHDALCYQFTLNLPHSENFVFAQASTPMENYDYNIGDLFVENLLLDYARHLFVGSCMQGSLPPNLQGIWTESLAPAWNTITATVGLYHRYTVPRGTESATLMYNAPGFVVLSNLNSFRFTDMPTAATHTHWRKTVGYPLMKSVAEYWIHEMVSDLYSDSGTLVAPPCYSPAHGWTEASGDTNTTFRNIETQAKLYPGIIIDWYPGYSICTHMWNKSVTDAVNAQLNNTDIAYTCLEYAIDMNYANNGFSTDYIDANFGYSAAVLTTYMLITDLPVLCASKAIHTIKNRSVKGMRIRGGGTVGFSRDKNGLVNSATLHNHKAAIEIANVKGKVLVQK